MVVRRTDDWIFAMPAAHVDETPMMEEKCCQDDDVSPPIQIIHLCRKIFYKYNPLLKFHIII